MTSSTLANAAAGQILTLLVCQDAVGNHSFAAPTNVKWNTVTLQTPNFCAAQGFIFDGTTAYNFAPATSAVQGTVAGLLGTGLGLQLNGGMSIALPPGAVRFTFPAPLSFGQTYSVAVISQPIAPPQACAINNASGTVGSGDVTNVQVACVTTASVPGAPSSVSATAGEASAVVTWTAPNNGGSPITGYIVTTNPGGTTTPANWSPATITGLTDGTPYTFTVAAMNAVGVGPASSPTSGVIPSNVPAAMPVPTTTPLAASILVSWSAPPNNGAIIDGYQIDTSSTLGDTFATASSSATSFTVIASACPYPAVDCATPTTYSHRLRAHSAGGYGSWSPFSGAVRPLVSYVADHIPVIWTVNFPSGSCGSCHFSGHLPDFGAGSPAGYSSATAEGTRIYDCPSQAPACPGIHVGYQLFGTNSVEYRLLLQWVLDGNLR